MTQERFVTVKDWAKALRCSPDTVRHYEQRGIIPPAMRHPVNGYRVWERSALTEAAARLQPTPR